MKFEKCLVINIGDYQSLRIGISNAPSYEACDQYLISELERIGIPVNATIKQVIQWEKKEDEQ